jgi:hypothetical protein
LELLRQGKKERKKILRQGMKFLELKLTELQFPAEVKGNRNVELVYLQLRGYSWEQKHRGKS